MLNTTNILLFIIILFISTNSIGGVRDHTRSDFSNGPFVTKSQASELTLTLIQADWQTLQTWFRLAATIDSSRQQLTSTICSDSNSNNMHLIQAGQRVRAFTANSKSSIYQARISNISSHDDCLIINAQLTRKSLQKSKHYVMEIIVERGQFLSIPKEAIIEEENKQIVYIKHKNNRYLPQEIKTGLKGELYTEILSGLNKGDNVVTFGSFFIDAENKLKSLSKSGGKHAHQHH